MGNYIQMLQKKERKKEEGEEEDLEFALIDRRPRSCAEAPVKKGYYCSRFHCRSYLPDFVVEFKVA